MSPTISICSIRIKSEIKKQSGPNVDPTTTVDAMCQFPLIN